MDGCWMWAGSRQGSGYGQVRDPERDQPTTVHRAMYELVRGAVPEGQQLHHLCRQRWCCNPWHLEALTPGEHNAEHDPQRKSPTCLRCGGANWYFMQHHGYTARRCRNCRNMQRRAEYEGPGHATGARNARTKLDWPTVRAIRADHAAGVGYPTLAKRYGIGSTTAEQIVKHRTWRE